MLTKLKSIREEREEGFTLIELLVVILIIGILAAIAIPVFLNQRQTANDAAVKSDAHNAVLAAETWVTGLNGAKKSITQADATSMNVKASNGVMMSIQGDSNAYCIKVTHPNGKQYNNSKKLIYNSTIGGYQDPAAGTACTGIDTANSPASIG